MSKVKTYAPHEQRYCPKCQVWQSQEGGTGAGRSYRCGGCHTARVEARRANTLYDTFAELLKAAPGLTARQLSELSGHPIRNACREVSRLVEVGKLCVIKVRPEHRYFANMESLEATRAQVEADLAAHLIEARQRGLEKNRRYYRNTFVPRVAEARAKLPPKPPKVKAVKPKKEKVAKPPKAPKPKVSRDLTFRITQPKPIPAKTSLDAWKRAEPIIPAHVKVQVIPGYSGDRWQPTAPAYGFAGMGIGRYFA